MQKVLQDVVIVAQHGDDFIDDCIASLANTPYVCIHTGTTHPTGAYLKAYELINAKNYLFMQDSMKSLVEDPIFPFKDVMPELGAVAWSSFPYNYDNSAQRDWVEEQYTDTPIRGIFGPVFYTSRETLELLDKLHLLPRIPTNKNEAQATERAWACAFHMAGLPVEYLYEWAPEAMTAGKLSPFQKTFANRQ